MFITLVLTLNLIAFPVYGSQNDSPEQLQEISLQNEKYYIDLQDTKSGKIVHLFDSQYILLQTSEANIFADTLTTIFYPQVNASSLFILNETTPTTITQKLSALSEIIPDTEEQLAPNIQSDIMPLELGFQYNYVFDEPLLDSDRHLDTWSEDGYKYIGWNRRTGDSTTGYLYRSQYTSTSESRRYNFSVGTAVSAIIATICLSTDFTTLGLASWLGAGVGEVIHYALSSVVGVKRIHNYYRVRVGYNFTLRFSFCICNNYGIASRWDSNLQKKCRLS